MEPGWHRRDDFNIEDWLNMEAFESKEEEKPGSEASVVLENMALVVSSPPLGGRQPPWHGGIDHAERMDSHQLSRFYFPDPLSESRIELLRDSLDLLGPPLLPQLMPLPSRSNSTTGATYPFPNVREVNSSRGEGSSTLRPITSPTTSPLPAASRRTPSPGPSSAAGPSHAVATSLPHPGDASIVSSPGTNAPEPIARRLRPRPTRLPSAQTAPKAGPSRLPPSQTEDRKGKGRAADPSARKETTTIGKRSRVQSEKREDDGEESEYSPSEDSDDGDYDARPPQKKVRGGTKGPAAKAAVAKEGKKRAPRTESEKMCAQVIREDGVTEVPCGARKAGAAPNACQCSEMLNLGDISGARRHFRGHYAKEERVNGNEVDCVWNGCGRSMLYRDLGRHVDKHLDFEYRCFYYPKCKSKLSRSDALTRHLQRDCAVHRNFMAQDAVADTTEEASDQNIVESEDEDQDEDEEEREYIHTPKKSKKKGKKRQTRRK